MEIKTFAHPYAPSSVVCSRPKCLNNRPLHLQWPLRPNEPIVLMASDDIKAYTRLITTAPIARTVGVTLRTLHCAHCHRTLDSKNSFKSKVSNHYFSTELCRDIFDEQRGPHARFFTEIQDRIAVDSKHESAQFIFKSNAAARHEVTCDELTSLELLVEILVNQRFESEESIQGHAKKAMDECIYQHDLKELANGGEAVHLPEVHELDVVVDNADRLIDNREDANSDLKYLKLAHIMAELGEDSPTFAEILPPPHRLVNLIRAMERTKVCIEKGLLSSRVNTGCGVYPAIAFFRNEEEANCQMYYDAHANLIVMASRDIAAGETISCHLKDVAFEADTIG